MYLFYCLGQLNFVSISVMDGIEHQPQGTLPVGKAGCLAP